MRKREVCVFCDSKSEIFQIWHISPKKVPVWSIYAGSGILFVRTSSTVPPVSVSFPWILTCGQRNCTKIGEDRETVHTTQNQPGIAVQMRIRGVRCISLKRHFGGFWSENRCHRKKNWSIFFESHQIKKLVENFWSKKKVDLKKNWSIFWSKKMI